MRAINVLSLCDGVACAKLALQKAQIKLNKYYASEVDKYAIKVAKHNNPDIVHIGDIKGVGWFGLPRIDLLVGGTPCQGFSFAGKQLNFNDPRSKLFFEFVRILKELKPTYFLLENVLMKKEYQEIISHHLGVEPIMIDSALLTAQSRKRLYWTNIPNITQPKDKGILLKDIIDGDYIADKAKSYCIDANYSNGGNLKQYFQKSRRQLVFKCNRVGSASDIKGHDYNRRIYNVYGKSPCLLANSKGSHEPKIAIDELTYRKLTIKECCRLQTLPEYYFDGIVSKTQAYKAIGNAFTVDVIAYILKHIKIY